MKTLPLTLVEVVKVAPGDRFRMTEEARTIIVYP